jgi:hypothetical protein
LGLRSELEKKKESDRVSQQGGELLRHGHGGNLGTGWSYTRVQGLSITANYGAKIRQYGQDETNNAPV